MILKFKWKNEWVEKLRQIKEKIAEENEGNMHHVIFLNLWCLILIEPFASWKEGLDASFKPMLS